MKLVEILARDLEEWPEGAKTLTQSFAGMVFYVSSKVEIVKIIRTELASDWLGAHVSKNEWQEARKP